MSCERRQASVRQGIRGHRPAGYCKTAESREQHIVPRAAAVFNVKPAQSAIERAAALVRIRVVEMLVKSKRAYI